MKHSCLTPYHPKKRGVEDTAFTASPIRVFVYVVFLAASILLLMANTAKADVTCAPPGINNITPYLGTWHGSIGASSITVFMEPHDQDPYRVQGYYTHLAEPQKKILIVGEPVNGRFDMEESIDGSDISGIWDIAFPAQAPSLNDCYQLLQGEWLDGYFENPQPITLQREISW